MERAAVIGGDGVSEGGEGEGGEEGDEGEFLEGGHGVECGAGKGVKGGSLDLSESVCVDGKRVWCGRLGLGDEKAM